jgi:hypothetical protein
MTYSDGTEYGNYSKTFSNFYDFSLLEKKCSLYRFSRTTQLIANQDSWCLYEGGANGRIFGYLPTDDRDPDTGEGKMFFCTGNGIDPAIQYANAIPCLIGDPEQLTLVENTNQGQSFFPIGCASLSPINSCVFGPRANRGAFPSGQTKSGKNGQGFGILVETNTEATVVSYGSFMPYNGQTFPVNFSFGGTGTGTYTIEIEA